LKKANNGFILYAAAFMAAVLVLSTGFGPAGSICTVKVYAGEKTEGYSSLDKVFMKLKKKSSKYTYKNGKDGSDTANDNKDGDDNINVNKNDAYEYTKEELRLLSSIIYCEAGSMGEDAAIAVANVIFNRMRDTEGWGHVSTIKEVIYDDKWGVQFSPIKGNPSSLDKAIAIYDNLSDYEGKWQYTQMMNSINAAKKAFEGIKVIPDSYMYFNGSIEKSKDKCESQGRSYIIIDNHIYFE